MDSALIDAMATAMRERPSELGDAYARELAAFLLDGLAQRRPGIAALLRGEAVAVPKEMTWDMSTAWVVAYANSTATSGDDVRRESYRAMLAASPFAREAP